MKAMVKLMNFQILNAILSRFNNLKDTVTELGLRDTFF